MYKTDIHLIKIFDKFYLPKQHSTAPIALASKAADNGT
jgi:hypothetical protein